MSTVRLDALQREFLQHLFDPTRDEIARWIKADGLAPTRRLDVYRNNVLSNYISALEAVYPVIVKLVGDEFFRHVARQFSGHYPSSSGDIHHFGREFGDFLAEFPGTVDLAYLPDVARLEWAIHQAFHAANDSALDLTRMQALAPQQYEKLVFHLSASAHLLRSAFPVRRIWEVNQADVVNETVDLDAGGENLLIIRRGFEVYLEPLAAAEFEFLHRCNRGERFGSALEAAVVIDGNVGPGAMLQKLVLIGAIVDFSV